MNSTENTAVFPKGDRLTNEYFSGNAYLHVLLAKDKNHEFALGSVTFEPGARTNWHTHPKGQVLIIIEGEGLFQEKAMPAQKLKKGDVVNIAEDIEHWHGASADATLVHIAITNYKANDNVRWLKPVTDEEYNVANKK